jgi:PhnB protein
MATNYMPPGRHTVTPYLMADKADELIRFAQQTFDAQVLQRVDNPDGKLMHAELKIGDSTLMLGQASAEHPANKTMLYLYFPNVDEVFRKGVAAGATAVQEPQDQFYGDRAGALKDTSGHIWWVACHLEDVSDAELKQRMAAMGKTTGTAASVAGQ